MYKKIIISFFVINLFLATTVMKYQEVQAGALKLVYKVADDFAENVVESLGEKSGKKIDVNDFKKADGSIDFEAYKNAKNGITNIVYKSAQDTVDSVKKEFKDVLEGNTDVVKKTPLKDLPGWSKVLISGAAAVTGADILFDIYQYANGGSVNEDNLQQIDGKLTTVATSNGQGSYGKPVSTGETDYSSYASEYSIPSTTPINDVQAYNIGTFNMEFVTTQNGSTANTVIYIKKQGYSGYQTVGLGFVPTKVIVTTNANGNKANIFMMSPAYENRFYKVDARYNVNTVSENYTLKNFAFDSVYGYSLVDVARYFDGRGIYSISNVVAPLDVPEVITTVVEEVPKLTDTGVNNLKQAQTETLIVPNGLTQQQIAEQVAKTPEIMSDPEAFLEKYPEHKPETKPGEEGALDGPACKKDLEMPELEALGSTLKATFPFSIPFALVDAINAVFGGMGSDRPSFEYKFNYQGKENVWKIELPRFFDGWKPFTDTLLVFVFDIGILYAIYRFVAR